MSFFIVASVTYSLYDFSYFVVPHPKLLSYLSFAQRRIGEEDENFSFIVSLDYAFFLLFNVLLRLNVLKLEWFDDEFQEIVQNLSPILVRYENISNELVEVWICGI